MKIKFLWLCVFFLLLSSCAVRKKRKESRTEEQKTNTNTMEEKIKDSLVVKKVVEEREINKAEKRILTEKSFVIEGETDTQNDFVFYETKNRDTIRSIRISGTAKYSIQTKTTENQSVTEEISREIQRDSLVKIIQDSIIVKREEISSTREEKNIEEVKRSNIPLPLSVSLILVLLILLCVWRLKNKH